MRIARLLMITAFLGWVEGGAVRAQDAHSVTITGDPVTEDTTLYSNQTTQNGGGGTDNRAGRTNTAGNRRLLIRFDVSSIPSNATITNITLEMTVTRIPILAPSQSAIHEVHRVTNSWVEGAGIGGGSGGQIVEGAATWDYREFSTLAWTIPGGDFVATASASTDVGLSLGAKTWSGAGMVADVQGWVNGSAPNFGWIIIGNENVVKTARAYASAEALNPQSLPSLTVDYTTLPVKPGDSWFLH